MKSFISRFVPIALWGVVCLIVAGLVLADATMRVTRASNPDLALSVSPKDGDALAAKIDTFISGDGNVQNDISIYAVPLKLALARQAVSPRGLRQLGMIADVNGNRTDARKFMKLSTTLSRRDLVAQLWLIEDGVQSGDIASTISHYDVALRTRPEGTAILYPILAAALDDEDIQRVVIPFFAMDPPWLLSFLTFAINGGSAPVAVAQMIEKAGGLPTGSRYQPLQTYWLQQLVATGEFSDAFGYYSRLNGAKPDLATSTVFSVDTIEPRFTPLTWQPQNSVGIDAIFELAGSDGRRQLHVQANSGERGMAIRKLMTLEAGRYRFSQIASFKGLPSGANYYWQMQCAQAAGATSVWRSDLNGDQIVIKSGCNAQYLELFVTGGNGQEGSELTVKSIQLSKIRDS